MKRAPGYPDMRYVSNMPKEDCERYVGQWIVVVNNEVVWHNKSSRGLQRQVDKFNSQGITPVIHRVSKPMDLAL